PVVRLPKGRVNASPGGRPNVAGGLGPRNVADIGTRPEGGRIVTSALRAEGLGAREPGARAPGYGRAPFGRMAARPRHGRSCSCESVLDRSALMPALALGSATGGLPASVGSDRAQHWRTSRQWHDQKRAFHGGAVLDLSVKSRHA